MPRASACRPYTGIPPTLGFSEHEDTGPSRAFQDRIDHRLLPEVDAESSADPVSQSRLSLSIRGKSWSEHCIGMNLPMLHGGFVPVVRRQTPLFDRAASGPTICR